MSTKRIAGSVLLAVAVCIGAQGPGWAASDPETRDEWVTASDAACGETKRRLDGLAVPPVLQSGERVAFTEMTPRESREVAKFFAWWSAALAREGRARSRLTLAYLKANRDTLSEEALTTVGSTEAFRLRRDAALRKAVRSLERLEPGRSDDSKVFETLGDVSIVSVRAAQTARHAGLQVCSEPDGSCCLLRDAAASLEQGWVPRCVDSIDAGNAVGCEQPHGAELYAVGNHPAPPGVEYPTGGSLTMPQDMLAAFVDDACAAAFGSYVGRDVGASKFDFKFFLADEDEWDAGERYFGCLLIARDSEPLAGSAKGTAA